jgi:hypothetical protein
MIALNKFPNCRRRLWILHHRALRYWYLYLYQQEGVFVFVGQEQEHVTVLEKTVEIDVMPSLLSMYDRASFNQVNKRTNRCNNN